MVLDAKNWGWLALLVVLDQSTKYLVLLTKPANDLFQLVWNTGAGFGILQGRNWILLVISLVVLVLIWRPLEESKKHEHAAYIMLAAGIIGNSIDRLVHHAVVDFISIASFPVFNVADSLITISILFLVAKGLKESFGSWHFHKIRKSKAKK